MFKKKTKTFNKQKKAEPDVKRQNVPWHLLHLEIIFIRSGALCDIMSAPSRKDSTFSMITSRVEVSLVQCLLGYHPPFSSREHFWFVWSQKGNTSFSTLSSVWFTAKTDEGIFTVSYSLWLDLMFHLKLYLFTFHTLENS